MPALNAMYELLQIHRRSMCTLEELEREQLKKTSSLEHMQMSNSRLKVSVTDYPDCYVCSARVLTTRGQERNRFLYTATFLHSYSYKKNEYELIYTETKQGQPLQHAVLWNVITLSYFEKQIMHMFIYRYSYYSECTS